MKKIFKQALQWLIAFLIMVVSLYWAFKDIEWNQLVDTLKEVNYLWTLISVPIILASHYLRAFRWKIFLTPIKQISSTWNLFSAVMILYAVNTILPRGGEFLRPYVVSRREKISYSSTFATVILERIVDLISLMIVFGLTFALLSENVVKILPKNINPTSIIVLSTLLIVVSLIMLYPPYLDIMLRVSIKPLSKKLYEKSVGIFDRFKKGLHILKDPTKYMEILFQSLLIWFLYSLPIYVTFFAFDFQSELNLGLLDATMLVIVAGIATTIAPSPGGVGVYHVFMMNSMISLYNLDQTNALAFATVVHGVSILTQTVVGFLFFKREGLTSFSPKTKMEE